MLPARTLATDDRQLDMLIEDTRGAMEDTMASKRAQCRSYLNWYSPRWDPDLGRHDAWETPIDWNEDRGTTRDNFPIARAVVDIWTSLEAAKPPMARAEPEYVAPPLPVLDEYVRGRQREQYDLVRVIEDRRAEIRGQRFRDYLRRDAFPLKHHRVVRRKNLYGFAWMFVTPNGRERRPSSSVLRNPTTVFPIWSTHDPDELEGALSVQQESVVGANARYGLGLPIKDGRVQITGGGASERYEDVNLSRYFDDTRTKLWVEDFWWSEREYNDRWEPTRWCVWNAKRVMGKFVTQPSGTFVQQYPWLNVPYVYWENSDERDEFGWSDVAGVIDINDEFNRRLSEEGDILSMYAHPRFQLTGSVTGKQVTLPAGDEIITLEDTERIDQILARIDVYPVQTHVQTLIDMLHRVTGLPPIVWGLIANAQTSGRALSASWKATEARLVPKLMRNEQSIRRWTDITIDYARAYDWDGGRRVWADSDGQPFEDIRWTFPPMEPRDYQEVTMDAITRRDAGLTTSKKAMRDTGDENAEQTYEEVGVEFSDPIRHPDKAQAQLMYLQARLQLMQQAQAAGAQPPQQTTPASVAQTVGQAPPQGAGGQPAAPPGMEGSLPPTQPGAAGNAGQPGGAAPGGPPPTELSSGTLVRNGEVSNQFLQTRRYE
jgi:hypothetical protein